MIAATELLRNKAHELALTHQLRTNHAAVRREWKKIAAEAESLQAYIRQLGESRARCASPIEDWLLDHAEFIQEQIMGIQDDARSPASLKLPMLRKPARPRIIEICAIYLELTDGEVEERSWQVFIDAYQEISILTIAEGWAMSSVFRVAIIQGISQLMESINERRMVCADVEQIVAKLAPDRMNPEELNAALDDLDIELPMSGPMIVHLIEHLREWSDDSGTVRNWLHCKLENEAENLDQIVTYEHQLQTAKQMTMGRLVGSLRAISRWDWRRAFSNMCLVEKTLSADQAGIYPLMDDASRDFLRFRVQQLASRMKVPENLVAEHAVSLAAKARQNIADDSEHPREAQLAYYLLEDKGIGQLKDSLHTCSKPRRMPEYTLWKRSVSSYFTLLAICFILMLIAFINWVHPEVNGSQGGWLWVLLFLLAPAAEWGMVLAHWVIQCCRRTQPLLKYDFSGGIPEEAATMVVVPVIWSSREEVILMVDRLEQHYLANRGPNLYYALLGDYRDSDQATRSEDRELLDAAKAEIERLNAAYHGDVFHLYHRSRRFNEGEGQWIGWERKRGKIVEFVELMKGRKDTTFEAMIGNTSVLSQIRYLITLDADTQLPITCAQRMIGAMHLPYNRPQMNKERTRVVEGYGILQPRVAISLESSEHSKLSHLLARNTGYDPYIFAVSDPYQDSLGHGIFVGKGIIDVDVFSELLCRRIPDNTTLSHDLLEGGILRAGLLSDVELIDGHPATFLSYQKRQHRWVRGDWQLIRWLLRKARDRNGDKRDVPLSLITKFQIIDNLRRSLLEPSLIAMMLLAVLVLPGDTGRWLGLAIVTLLLPAIRYSIAVLQWRNLPSLLGQRLLSVLTLPYTSVVHMDAIIRSLYRQMVSRRRLLEWVSMGEVDLAITQERQPAILFRGTGYAISAAFFIMCLINGQLSIMVTGICLTVLWMFAPAVVRYLDGPLNHRSEVALEAVDSAWLLALARDIWAFYEKYVTSEERYLPPDNVQVNPPSGIAHRTSPTNIGLYLASALSARDFGFIDSAQWIERMDQTLTTIEQLDKWEGHLYNWYDTRTLEPLHPRYVSTVDSGNLIVCLITVMEGLRQCLNEDEQSLADQVRKQGRKLLARLELVIHHTQFQALYDNRSKLFVLGYYPDTCHRDQILYDLLASEARQTSFVAIALHQVSVAHWHALGRTLAKVQGKPALISWSGTMFEFLMPGLFMRTYRNTIWASTYQAIVDRQLAYAEERNVPMGISESGYYAFDYQMNYQYRAFGVPGLGFQRGLELDVVVAPYATIMSLPYAGEAGLRSLRRMEQLGARGSFGFYEAIDFTKKRLPDDKDHMVIQSFMAHHQGMAMLTIGNMLLPVSMPDRFHQNKEVRSVDWLLQERVPAKPKYIEHRALSRVHENRDKPIEAGAVREYSDPITALPEVCLLSNEHCSTMITTMGSGYFRYEDIHVSRWKEDAIMDSWGSYIYIRDLNQDRVWSPTYEPTHRIPDEQYVQFGLDKALFTRVDGGIRTALEVCVAPEYPAEIRRLALTNLGKQPVVLEVTSYLELSLSVPAADEAHPAFSKLFIRTAYVPEVDCLTAGRRTREFKGKQAWAAHKLQIEGDSSGATAYATDRASFIGRGNTLANPRGLHMELLQTTGSVADPVFVMRRRVSIDPGETTQLMIMTTVARTEEEAVDWIMRLSQGLSTELIFHLAWNRSQVELRHLHLTASDTQLFQGLAGQLLYTPTMKARKRRYVKRNVRSQTSLWAHGISGDQPILLVTISDRVQLAFVHKLIVGHEYLRRKGLTFDLVVLNESDGGYRQELRDALLREAEHGVDRYGASHSGVHIIQSDQLTEADFVLLHAVSRVVLHANGPSLEAQLRPLVERIAADPLNPTLEADVHRLLADSLEPANSDHQNLLYDNGWGGFSLDGNEYRLTVSHDHSLPAPWINVLANRQFGCLVSELGTGYSWWRNSRECKLTPWSNDPMLDPPGELYYIRDEETGAYWQPTGYGNENNLPFYVTHGHGYSIFKHLESGIETDMRFFVPVDDPLKLIKLVLHNRSDKRRELSVTSYAEWVIGVKRQVNASFIDSEWLDEEKVLLARNLYQDTFREANAFVGMYTSEDDSQWSWTVDRREFIGRGGSRVHPESLSKKRLSGRVGLVSDSCGAIQTKFSLAPGEQKVIYLFLGCEASRESAVGLIRKYTHDSAFNTAWDEMRRFWDATLEQIQVETPSKEMDILLNGWLLYQTLACRMWARTAFYQAGGATGFRDQLQDSLAVMHTIPELTKQQILLHAAHQYEEGDVQHWWHEETGMGIRTKFTDDLLWLPYACSRYLEHTENVSILELKVTYLHSEVLREDEHERYEPTVLATADGTLYDHCCRAIDKALSRFGEHGLPLIGVGDWNDGMNLVGDEGRGESVWLGWFLSDVLRRFEPICEKRKDSQRAGQYRQRRLELASALDEHGWDEAWYRRAITDEGHWLGSMHNEECRIDAIAQSWSVISGAGDPQKSRTAMLSFDRELVDRDIAVARLLTPPFDRTEPSPGYIQGYPPGIRENGAQYTHGVIWSIVAWSKLGEGDKAFELFHLLNPINHTRTPLEVRTYWGEPYVMAADVYTKEPHVGRAGWTWYTGASGWMYQAGIEAILGIRRRGDQLWIEPCIPHQWKQYKVKYRYEQTSYSITIHNPSNRSKGISRISVDGVEDVLASAKSDGASIQLKDDGKTHFVELIM
jgi:cyclic beta-1,2-glucan synthetase